MPSSKKHRHTFHSFSWTFGPYGRQDVHVHDCWDIHDVVPCRRVLIGPTKKCDHDAATHWRETLE